MPDAVTSDPTIDTHDMIVIHRAFRRESRLLAGLIAAVPDGDVERAAILGRHLHWYEAGLSNHHRGEDELVWPLLRSRVDTGSEIVASMEHQHNRVANTLEQVLGRSRPGRTRPGTGFVTSSCVPSIPTVVYSSSISTTKRTGYCRSPRAICPEPSGPPSATTSWRQLPSPNSSSSSGPSSRKRTPRNGRRCSAPCPSSPASPGGASDGAAMARTCER